MKTDETLSELAGLMASIDDPEMIRGFLEGMLTTAERDKIALRWQLVCLLQEGMSQRAIAEHLRVSLCKITRGSHELQHGPEGFKKMVVAFQSRRQENGER